MCHPSVLEFGTSLLTRNVVSAARVLEVGSLNVNGSLREHVLSLGPTSYVGVDVVEGPGVDLILPAGMLVDHFGEHSFDVVISTEMLEHADDWRGAVSNMKRVLAPGGSLLITTRSYGFALHHEPDYWRFEIEDMRAIFSDLHIMMLIPDPGGSGGGPGVFLYAIRPGDFDMRKKPALGTIKLYSMATGERE